jgi:hypothetical protein
MIKPVVKQRVTEIETFIREHQIAKFRSKISGSFYKPVIKNPQKALSIWM